MSTGLTLWSAAVFVGLGATLFMDAWALLMHRAFGVPLANYCLVGRWLRHMPQGTFAHASIAAAPPKAGECIVGWITHYVTGVVYALVLVAIVSGSWLLRPTLLPAMLFGIGSVLVPYLIMHPAFGLGIAASKAPQPAQARLRSLMAHASFGFGLYLGAVCAGYALRLHA
jgi:cytochrome b561